jgi:hypothetical protein
MLHADSVHAVGFDKTVYQITYGIKNYNIIKQSFVTCAPATCFEQ